MERMVVLGTGNAMVTKCYNTCFALCAGEESVLVDAGGGNGILRQLKLAGVEPAGIRHLIVTHEHCDHLLGVVWVIRQIATAIKSGSYTGAFHIHCHSALAQTIQTICVLTLQKKFTALFGDRIVFEPVENNTSKQLLDSSFTFFDIHSSKALQFGFTALLPDGKRLTCLGDEPCNPCCEVYAQGCDWLLSEAFCLFGERKRFHPYEKHHSTVKDACELAERLQVRNLVLWHTEDANYEARKMLYTQEGAQYFHGTLLIPYDLETLLL